MSGEQQIRALIEGWVAAIRAGDLAAVLTDHTDDIVMFDVPPPERGVRGADAYEQVWPPFLEFVTGPGSFDLVELDVVAGAEVAYAYALLRCGVEDELAADPDRRLRLSLGLVRRDDRWQVQHEHHSFTPE